MSEESQSGQESHPSRPFTAVDAQNLELQVSEAQNEYVLAFMKAKVHEKLVDWIHGSRATECMFEIPFVERPSPTMKKFICERLVLWLEDRGFQVSNRSFRDLMITISWGHVMNVPLARKDEAKDEEQKDKELTAQELWRLQNFVIGQENDALLQSLLEDCDRYIQQCIQDTKQHKAVSSCVFNIPVMTKNGMKVDKNVMYDAMVANLRSRNFVILEESPLKQSFRVSWDPEDQPSRMSGASIACTSSVSSPASSSSIPPACSVPSGLLGLSSLESFSDVGTGKFDSLSPSQLLQEYRSGILCQYKLSLSLAQMRLSAAQNPQSVPSLDHNPSYQSTCRQFRETAHVVRDLQNCMLQRMNK
jgi:hypothetical protein